MLGQVKWITAAETYSFEPGTQMRILPTWQLEIDGRITMHFLAPQIRGLSGDLFVLFPAIPPYFTIFIRGAAFEFPCPGVRFFHEKG